MKCLDHKVKILIHVMVKHHNWIEDASVKAELAAAKAIVQQALKPGQVPGGSQEENEGIFKPKNRKILSNLAFKSVKKNYF